MQSEKLRKSPQFCEIRDRNPKNLIEWIDYLQKNKPQTNALAAGIMLMTFSGQQLGWGIFNSHITEMPWAGGYEDEGTVFWGIICWFIAVIAGLVVGALFVGKLSKMSIYIFASILSASSATLFIIHPSSIYYVFPGRILSGFSHGITYLTLLIHASEVSIPKLRGMVVSTIHFCLMVGVFMSSTSLMPVYKTRSYEVDPTQTIGYNGLICIVTGVVLAVFLEKESPVYLIKNYRDDEALEMMVRLRSESHETGSVRHDFSEFKVMVMEDSQSSLNIFKYFRQLSIVLLLKLIFVASFNMPLNVYFLDLAKPFFYDSEYDLSGVWLSGSRWIVMIVSMFLIDLRRIKIFLTSSVGCGFVLILLILNEVNEDSVSSLIIAISFQMLAGLAVGFMSDIYSVDSVNTRIKPMFIAVTSIFENLIQIFLIVSVYYMNIPNIYLFSGLAGILFLGIVAHQINQYFTIIPDTSGLSLRMARNVMKYGP